MSDLKPSDELAKPFIHPTQRNQGPDTVYDWDMEPWYRLQAEFIAERESISIDEAKMAIKGGLANRGEWMRPREENVPLSRTVEDEGSN